MNKMRILTAVGLLAFSATSFVGAIHKQGKHKEKAIQERKELWDDVFSNVEQSLQNQYSIKTSESEDGKSYSVAISMPGFEEKDIKVTISTTENSSFDIRKTLQVVAPQEEKKDEKVETKKEVKAKHGRATVIKTSNETFYSTTVVNGMVQKIMYNNGKIECICDLPASIDDKKYTMTLRDGVLTITFPKIEKHIQQRELEFSKEKNK